MRRPTAAVVVVTSALTGAVLLSGCGATGVGTAYRTSAVTNLAPAAAVRAATDATARSGSASVHLSVTRTAGGTTESVDVRGVAAIDGSAADLTTTLPDGALGGTGRTAVRQRLVDGVLYLRVEGSDAIPSTWLELDPADLPDGLGDVLGAGAPGGADALTAPLDALREVADVEEIGRDDLDGVATTHYRATLDPSKAASALDGLPGARPRRREGRRCRHPGRPVGRRGRPRGAGRPAARPRLRRRLPRLAARPARVRRTGHGDGAVRRARRRLDPAWPRIPLRRRRRRPGGSVEPARGPRRWRRRPSRRPLRPARGPRRRRHQLLTGRPPPAEADRFPEHPRSRGGDACSGLDARSGA